MTLNCYSVDGVMS